MKIYAAHVGKLTDEKYERCIALLDGERQEKVREIKHDAERQRSMYAGLLLRYAYLAEGFGEKSWERARVVRGTCGKPYLADTEGFFYSLSHSGEWVVCAVDDIEVGADIQEIGALKMAVAKRFYSDGEYGRLIGYEPDKDRQTAEFYRMWAAKESCAKLIGRGIGAGVSSYVTDRSYGFITDTTDCGRFYTRLYEDIRGYEACVCSTRESFPEKMVIVDVADND